MPISFLTPDDLPTAFDPSAINARLDLLESNVAALQVAPPDPAIAALQTAVADLASRVTALEPVVQPPPPPPPPPPAELNLQLAGGWRLTGEFSRGQLAIDHTTMRAWISGHGQRAELIQYQLPAMGTGTDLAQWPKVIGTVLPGWWGSGLYANGLRCSDGKVYVLPKNGYDTTPPATMTEFCQDGTTKVIPLPRQAYSGYVKSATGYEYGCGGYESGQGWCKGPSLGVEDGTVKIFYPQNATFDTACPREPNYWLPSGGDSWVAWTPRKDDGTRALVPITDTAGLHGRWACDRIKGGGLRFSHGIYYWVTCGTGDLDYQRQNETFAAANKTYLYRFDPVTYQLKGWKLWDVNPALQVCGQEVSPDGKYVYLTRINAWKNGSYTVDPILEVYEVK